MGCLRNKLKPGIPSFDIFFIHQLCLVNISTLIRGGGGGGCINIAPTLSSSFESMCPRSRTQCMAPDVDTCGRFITHCKNVNQDK